MHRKIGRNAIQFMFGLRIRRSINKWSLIIRRPKRKSKKTRVTNSAVNILDAIPSISTMAKPFTSSDARQRRIAAVMNVVRLASKIVLNALW